MKRYKYAEISAHHILTDTEFVEHEPWMDEAERQYKTPVTMSADVKKEPTICVKCKRYCVEGHSCVTYPMNYVTGKPGIYIDKSFEKNKNGSCPDYEPR